MSSAGTCINNTSVMMFKKGSFEIDCTVYPVAIKVQTFSVFFSSFLLLPTLDFTLFPSCSMILGLGMLSGTAVSLAWWIICWGWWAAGPLSAAFGTCRLWTERWNSLSQHYKEMFGDLPKWVIELSDHLLFILSTRVLFTPFLLPVLFLLSLCRKGRMRCSLPTEWKQP